MEDMAVSALSAGRTVFQRPISQPTRLALGVGVLAGASGAATYAILTGLTPYNPDRAGLIVLLLLNLALGLTLGALIAWRLVRLWAERKSGRAGAKLHVRLVIWFSAIAVVPAILVAIFAAVTLNLGLETWFSNPVRDALGSAVNVAQVYVNDHAGSIEGDAIAIANLMQQDPSLFDENHHVHAVQFISRLSSLTKDRGLRASYILDNHGVAIISTQKPGIDDPKPVSARDLADARKGVVIDARAEDGRITALIRMRSLNDAYLMVMRVVDPKVFNYYRRTRDAVSEYDRLSQNRQYVQLVFFVMYALVSLVILLAAILSGIWAANRLVQPISNLIDASERVSEGDLTAQVTVERDDDEIGTLGIAFNRMTQQLSAQREDLVTANRVIDQRRRFTETVLSGVSAGVIGLDNDGHITIVNRAAARLLDATPEDMEGRPYTDSVPEMAVLIRRALSEPAARAGGEVVIRRAGKPRTLSVQVSSEHGSHGFVVTFDDITDLVSAQRTAAWADVARRIAHEIKNPLTPIQLSAERLKRKYAGEVTSDPEVFRQCTDTIIRQVGDIGRMVDEFSSFARMPAPVMRRENAQELLHQAVFLQRVANPAITFDIDAPREPVHFEGDGRLVAQALTNVLKNAGEGVAARLAKGDEEPGRIVIALQPVSGGFSYRVTDNGIGLPREQRDRLTEPYVTTRVKGTGLGLAIVRKIMEDHGGELTLGDAEGGEGAEVTLRFPFVQKTAKGVEDEQKRIADRV
jgi:two-component system, NtrC family, nitrogen regulation sensor histidine kinase NtrY